MESNIQANTPEPQELAHLLRELPRQTPPAELTDRIMAGLPGRPGIIGLVQYNLLRPRQLPAAASASLLLPAALFQLLLAAFLYHFSLPPPPFCPPPG
ncbi:MAG: hypothetical protein U5J62_08970 [Desulfurivibrio sp.]|nr:hypothetical protein [Desulfurivibrio sp.]